MMETTIDTTDEITEEEVQEIAIETMLGDLMKTIITQYKALPSPWQSMPKYQQKDVIYSTECAVKEAIEKAVSLIASEGFQTISAAVEQVTFKGGVKAVLTMARGAEGAHEIADAEGSLIEIVIPNIERFLSTQGLPEAEEDQADLVGAGEEYMEQ